VKTITVAKARGMMEIDDTEPATILITDRLPDFERDPRGLAAWQEIVASFYNAQAEAIVRGLLSLPGGSLDRVLAKLVSRSVSLHRIPWE
jgi:hypothetical protein